MYDTCVECGEDHPTDHICDGCDQPVCVGCAENHGCLGNMQEQEQEIKRITIRNGNGAILAVLHGTIERIRETNGVTVTID